jgi:uncharacterized protein Yka (UPF0111/DUF47 family)
LSSIRRLVTGRRDAPQLWAKIAELSSTCAAATKCTEAAFISVASGDRQAAISDAQKVNAAVRKGMALIRESRRMLIQADLSSPVHGDALVILESSRDLLESAKAASCVIVQRRLSPSVVYLLNDPKLQFSLSKLFEKVGQVATSLLEAIGSLPSSPSKSVELSSSVSKMVEDVDSARLYLLERLYEQEKSIDVLSLMQLRDIIYSGSRLVESFDDCSESLQALATAKT